MAPVKAGSARASMAHELRLMFERLRSGGVDVVSELLAEVRARGAVFRQAIVRPPWALRMATGAPLMLATVVRGEAWIVPD
ncbi:cupin domain-containing protein, partial [Actinosynnema sp.]|uniref:cupin domain-containing protein n=1 Tax=Actinosynnema sp. TaxID=1872144 RepID=UPI003F86C62C